MAKKSSRYGYGESYKVPNPIAERPLTPLRLPPAQPDLDNLPKGTLLPYFGPDQFAEISVVFPAEKPFSCLQMAQSMTQDWRQSVGLPTFYVETLDGHVTYMVSANGPAEGVKLIAAWPLYKPVVAKVIVKAANDIAEWLSWRAQNFTIESPSQSKVEQHIKNALAVRSLDEITLGVELVASKGKNIDGQTLWHAMHDLGFEFDNHQFELGDQAHSGDALISAITYGPSGYEQPFIGDIEKGRQNFNSIFLSFNGLRTRSPQYILELIKTAAYGLLGVFDGELKYKISETSVENITALEKAIDDVVSNLSEFDLKAGSTAVLMLH